MNHSSKKVTAVILAAGQAERMGQPKQLLPWGAETILGQTLSNVKASTAHEHLLVSGAYRTPVEAIAAAHHVPCVYNADFASGEMLSSLKTAVRYLSARPAAPDGILVMLADLPFIPTSVIDRVIAAFLKESKPLIAPVYNGRRGHPVLIGASLFSELLVLPADGAPRDLFRRYPDQFYAVEVASDVILRDIDTPEEYEDLRPQTSDNR